MKILRIYDSGFVWHVPLSVIAEDRAKYYAKRDRDTTYLDEYNYCMEDHHEALDWFLNNMDFEDVASDATLVATPKPLSAPRINSEFCECSIEEEPT
jgi:uridine kinase